MRLSNFVMPTRRALFMAPIAECVLGTSLQRKYCGKGDQRRQFVRRPAINMFARRPGRAIRFFQTRASPHMESKCGHGRRPCRITCASVQPGKSFTLVDKKIGLTARCGYPEFSHLRKLWL